MSGPLPQLFFNFLKTRLNTATVNCQTPCNAFEGHHNGLVLSSGGT